MTKNRTDSNQNGTKELGVDPEQLWQAADRLRGSVDAWIQHFIHHLAPSNGRGGGIAGFVMANGSLSSNTSSEGEIRRNIVEADLVDCIVAMPTQLFPTTGIPVCLWFVTRDKSGKKLKPAGRDRRGETLFIDARHMGTMETRTLRVLSGRDEYPLPADSDIGRIAGTYHAWRGEAQMPALMTTEAGAHRLMSSSDQPQGASPGCPTATEYHDIPGFCKSASLEEIQKYGFVLTPGRYGGAADVEDDGEPLAEKMQQMTAESSAAATSRNLAH